MRPLSQKTSAAEHHEGVILFNPVGTVHVRNMKILQRALPQFHFRALLRPRMPWFSTESKRNTFDVDYYTIQDESAFDDRIFDGDVRAIILSIAMPDIWVLDLLERAHNRNIPVIAIEEVHQLALNCGSINNYILPLDRILAASPYEKENFIKRGHPENCVTDVGWPFYSGLARTGGFSESMTLRRRICSQDDKVATLVLACLNDIDSSSRETRAVRKALLTIAHQGLPDNYKLAIKGHPNEPVDSIRKFADKYAPDAYVFGQEQDIHPVLSMTDLLLTRGNTQVAIEAMVRSIPICVIPAGINTVFNKDYPQVLCETPASLTLRIKNHTGHNLREDNFLEKHLPDSPETALASCTKCIEQIARTPEENIRKQKPAELTIYRNFIGFPKERDLQNILADAGLDSREKDSLYRILRFEAKEDDMIRIKKRYKGQSPAPFIDAFWIRQVREDSELIHITIKKNLLSEFPPQENAFLFSNASATWFGALCSLKGHDTIDDYLMHQQGDRAISHLLYQNAAKAGITRGKL